MLDFRHPEMTTTPASRSLRRSGRQSGLTESTDISRPRRGILSRRAQSALRMKRAETRRGLLPQFRGCLGSLVHPNNTAGRNHAHSSRYPLRRQRHQTVASVADKISQTVCRTGHGAHALPGYPETRRADRAGRNALYRLQQGSPLLRHVFPRGGRHERRHHPRAEAARHRSGHRACRSGRSRRSAGTGRR